MNNKGKNKDNLHLSAVKEGRGIIELGKLASMSIITEGSAYFTLKNEGVVHSTTEFLLDLREIEEATALKICILLGRSDAYLEKLLDLRS